MYFYAVFLLDSPLTFRTDLGVELPDFGVGIGMSGQSQVQDSEDEL